MKQYFASLIPKPLKYKISFNLAAINDNLKICSFLPFLYSTNINIQSLQMFTFFPIFILLKSDWLICIFAHSVLRAWGRIPPLLFSITWFFGLFCIGLFLWDCFVYAPISNICTGLHMKHILFFKKSMLLNAGVRAANNHESRPLCYQRAESALIKSSPISFFKWKNSE